MPTYACVRRWQGVSCRVKGLGFGCQRYGLSFQGVGSRMCVQQGSPPHALAHVHLRARHRNRLRGTTQGPSWGYSKVNLQQTCQFLTTISRRMAPSTMKRLQERGRDTPTKGLLRHTTEGAPFLTTSTACHRIHITS